MLFTSGMAAITGSLMATLRAGDHAVFPYTVYGGPSPALVGGSGELCRARSRLYRSQILQENMRWKALAEIYAMHSFAPFSNLKIFVKIAEIFADFFQNVATFARILLNFC